MDEFVALTLSFPTAVYTVLVLASLMYWMVSFVGLADLDSGDGDVGDAGDADAGDADAGDADAGDADAGDADAGDADGDAEAGEHGHGHEHGGHGHADEASGGVLDAILGLLSFLRLRNAPLSITLSVLFLFSWVFTYFGAKYGLPLIPGPDWLGGAAIGAAALVPSVPITSVLTKPLGGLFKQQFAPGRRHLVGRVGVVRIGATAPDGNAQVRLKDPKGGEKGLLLRVSTDDDLSSGDEVLLIDYDDDKKAYVAEPMQAVLPKEEEP